MMTTKSVTADKPHGLPTRQALFSDEAPAEPDVTNLFPVRWDKGTELPPWQWSQLEEGHRVLVQREGGAVLSGIVDTHTADGSVFWAWLDRGRGRIAVYANEGTHVWLPKGYGL